MYTENGLLVLGSSVIRLGSSTKAVFRDPYIESKCNHILHHNLSEAVQEHPRGRTYYGSFVYNTSNSNKKGPELGSSGLRQI